jgi:AP-4 complex subunit epsilon-1
LLLGAFHALSTVPLESLALTDVKESPIHALHSLIRADAFNAHWVVLECLRALDVRIWAGTDPRFPAALDQWEVGRIMGMLEGQDTGIRRKVTINLLLKPPNAYEASLEDSQASALC